MIQSNKTQSNKIQFLVENKNTYKFLCYIFSAAKFSKDFRDFFQKNATEMHRIYIFCESIMQLQG